MRDTKNTDLSNGVWFIYDGDCPICNLAAQSLRIREAVGPLTIINARENKSHPLYQEITDQKLDLDEGMVLRYGNRNYHGQNALQMMSFLGSNKGWYNRINGLLFKSPTISKLLYPIMKLARNTLLKLLGISRINNIGSEAETTPIFQEIFGDTWATMPPVMKAHYEVKPYSNDQVTVSGHLDVYVNPFVGMLARITGLLVPYSGKNVPVQVRFNARSSDKALEFDRKFSFPGRKPIHFRSKMVQQANGHVIEFMRYGFGWRFTCEWKNNKVLLSHRGYVLRVLGINIPMPLALLLGKGFAEEHPISDNEFSMWTHTIHPLFGKMFGYEGSFKVTEIKCDLS